MHHYQFLAICVIATLSAPVAWAVDGSSDEIAVIYLTKPSVQTEPKQKPAPEKKPAPEQKPAVTAKQRRATAAFVAKRLSWLDLAEPKRSTMVSAWDPTKPRDEPINEPELEVAKNAVVSNGQAKQVVEPEQVVYTAESNASPKPSRATTELKPTLTIEVASDRNAPQPEALTQSMATPTTKPQPNARAERDETASQVASTPPQLPAPTKIMSPADCVASETSAVSEPVAELHNAPMKRSSPSKSVFALPSYSGFSAPTWLPAARQSDALSARFTGQRTIVRKLASGPVQMTESMQIRSPFVATTVPASDSQSQPSIRSADAVAVPHVAQLPAGVPAGQSRSQPTAVEDIAAGEQVLADGTIVLPTPAPEEKNDEPTTSPPNTFRRQVPLQLESSDTDGVTLHVNNADVRQILELLSRSYGLNIVVGPEVEGKVTTNFEGVPPDVALYGVLKLGGLTSHEENGLIFVYSSGATPADQRPLRTYPLDYVVAEQILPAVTGLLSPAGQAFDTVISPTDDRRTQEAIVVIDDELAHHRIEQYIIQSDQPPRQVMIEAHVLEIKLINTCEHGVDYEDLLSTELEIDFTGLADVGSTPGLFARFKGADVTSLVQILQTTTDAKTLASPKLMVINGQRARIQVGEQLGYKVVTVTQTGMVEEVKFLDVGVVLEVTPIIGRDGRILMKVKPEVSSGRINPTTLLPEEETRELETAVLLNDGQGVVIGGLIQEEDKVVQKKLPWFGDLNYLGALFERREKTLNRNEIVIALVPRIMECECHTEEEAIQLEQVETPLLHRNLDRQFRPYEPRLMDPIDGPSRGILGKRGRPGHRGL